MHPEITFHTYSTTMRLLPVANLTCCCCYVLKMISHTDGPGNMYHVQFISECPVRYGRWLYIESNTFVSLVLTCVPYTFCLIYLRYPLQFIKYDLMLCPLRLFAFCIVHTDFCFKSVFATGVILIISILQLSPYFTILLTPYTVVCIDVSLNDIPFLFLAQLNKTWHTSSQQIQCHIGILMTCWVRGF
jgi:hypothetical protein